MRRLLAVDIDGTLTGMDRRLHIPSTATLRDLTGAGVCTVLATGNVVCFARSAQILMGTSGPVIAENGGVIQVERDAEPLPLASPEEPRRAYDALENRTGAELFPEERVTELAVRPESVPEDEVRGLADEFDVEVVYTGFAYHVKNPGVDKGTALRRVADELGYGLDETVAIGDSENDVEMIEAAGVGVAVANAHDVLKRSADLVTEAEYGDGVVEAIETLRARGDLPS